MREIKCAMLDWEGIVTTHNGFRLFRYVGSQRQAFRVDPADVMHLHEVMVYLIYLRVDAHTMLCLEVKNILHRSEEFFNSIMKHLAYKKDRVRFKTIALRKKRHDRSSYLSYGIEVPEESDDAFVSRMWEQFNDVM